MNDLVLLCLHGWNRNKEEWTYLETKLSGQIQTLAWDLPGFGKEPLISDSCNIPDYANWVDNKIKKELPGKKIILLGYSFGGRIASYLASRQPKYLNTLILYASPSLYRPTAKIKRKIALYKLLKHIIPPSLLKNFKSDDQRNVEHTSLEKIFRTIVTFDQTNDLKDIKVPTYIINGEKDQSVRVEIAEEMNSIIPKSEIIRVPNATHYLHDENPVLFTGIIKKIILEAEKNA